MATRGGGGTPGGAPTKDEAHISSDWELLAVRIDGVQVREVRNIVTGNGITTELFRKDWGIAETEITAMIHVTLHPDAVSAWHMHKLKTDHLFAVAGALRAVLYDTREESPTRGQLDVLNLSPMRPQLLVIPPGVWHGFKPLGAAAASFINFFDREYDYEDPDDWRLPLETAEIPYQF